MNFSTRKNDGITQKILQLFKKSDASFWGREPKQGDGEAVAIIFRHGRLRGAFQDNRPSRGDSRPPRQFFRNPEKTQVQGEVESFSGFFRNSGIKSQKNHPLSRCVKNGDFEVKIGAPGGI